MAGVILLSFPHDTGSGDLNLTFEFNDNNFNRKKRTYYQIEATEITWELKFLTNAISFQTLTRPWNFTPLADLYLDRILKQIIRKLTFLT